MVNGHTALFCNMVQISVIFLLFFCAETFTSGETFNSAEYYTAFTTFKNSNHITITNARGELVLFSSKALRSQDIDVIISLASFAILKLHTI